MTRVRFKKLMCLLLAVIITASIVPPIPVVAAAQEQPVQETVTQEKTSEELLKDVMAGVLTVEEAFGTLDANTVPEIVGYDTAVARTHIARMYDEEGDNLNQVIFLNADGTRTAYFYDHPVKYVDETGKIKDISLDIAETDVAGQFETAANSSVTTFSKNVTDGIGLRSENASISLVPHLPTAATKSLSATKVVANATAQKINNKTVAYTYDDKTTLEYSLTYTGFKEDIVVKEYTGQTRYDFTLYTNGLKLEERNGSFYLTDSAGAVKAQLGDIIIFTADDRNNTMGDMAAKAVVENQEYLLSILVDPEFLADEKTAYPIRIDPTIEFSYEDNGDYMEDVTINSNGGSDGTAYSLSVGLRSNYGIARTLMKFPIITRDVWTPDMVIVSAQVAIRDLMCETEATQVDCYAFTGNEWTETTANWSNVSPTSISSTLLSSHTISYASGATQPEWQTYAFDITAAAEGWLTGNYNVEKGIIFKAPDAVENGSTYIHKTLASFNRSSYKPTLSVTYSDVINLFMEDAYYLNNEYWGEYLQYAVATACSTSGLISSLGDLIRWEIVPVNGGYVIRSKTDSTKYLAVPENINDDSVVIAHVNNTPLPSRCIWTMTLVSGFLIKSNYNSRYLCCDSILLRTTSNIGTVGSSEYKMCTWRVADTNYYGNTSSNTTRELEEGFSVSTFFVNVGESAVPVINAVSANTLWASPSDFIFECDLNSDPIVYFDYGSCVGLGEHYGISNYVATHKVTGRTVVFVAYVERYVYELVNLYGFTPNEAMLIRSVYDTVDAVYENKSPTYRAWIVSRLLSSFDYLDILWRQTAGVVVYAEDLQSFFVDTLGYSVAEYTQIKEAITNQHSGSSTAVNTSDFAHMQASLAARLAYTLNTHGWTVGIAELVTDEKISYLAGWLGDATISSGGGIVLKNDDYMADLDAENLYRIVLNGTSIIDATNTYYNSLTAFNTRAHIFLGHIPYDSVQSKVFYELIDIHLYTYLNEAINNANPFAANSIMELINDEQYHWDTIYSNYPDTYNFLLSLQNRSANLTNYYE